MPDPINIFDEEDDFSSDSFQEAIAALGHANAPAPVSLAGTEHIANDFATKYKDSYVLANGPGFEKEMIYVAGIPHQEQVSAGSTTFEIAINVGFAGMAGFISYDQLKIVQPIPSAKLVNVENTVVSFTRQADRQWKRGCNKHTMFTSDVFSGEGMQIRSLLQKKGFILSLAKGVSILKISELPRNLFNQQVMYNLFFPKYPEFSTAYTTVKSGKALAVAFSEQYCITVSAIRPELLLRRGYHIIGKFENEKVITVKEPIFYQEVTDLFRRLNTGVRVI